MKKISTLIVFLLGFGAASFCWGLVNLNADGGNPMNATQVVHDEGYGNEDAEYYNSPDDVTNDEEPSSPQDNSLNNAQ